ncbi:hypothetical protein ILUMI_19694 [Ignelater luminosus]|uniref:Uncharacterized protein n=1 Tax=Ignelater luminosus TaxID=2038154 RepID=A0A8K0CFP8_IGNLU|nr:hypothetical protein ILUMI_19694 [Ignelater luminosus]
MKHVRVIWREPVNHILEKCINQSHVNPNVVEAFYEHGHMPHNPAFKCCIKCVTIELDILNPITGEVNAQKWSDTFDYLDLELAQQCIDQEEPDLCEKVFKMVDCVHDHVGKKFPPE